MSNQPATVIKMSIQRMVCTSCGAEANASCNCGVGYVPKALRAAEVVKANPEKSNRALAAEIGVDEKTVREARSGADYSAPEERIGLDGKTYPVRQRITAEAIAGWRSVFLRCAADAIRKAEHGAGLEYVKGPSIDDEIITTLSSVIQAWTRLLEDIQNRRNGND